MIRGDFTRSPDCWKSLDRSKTLVCLRGERSIGSPRPPVGPGRGLGAAKLADGKRFSEFEISLKGGSPF